MNLNISKRIDWNKCNELIPCIVQDYETRQVLMLGYMNKKSLSLSLERGKLTFYSRSKKRLWMKGENSGNFLQIKELKLDCDQDTLLARVNPIGPCCHLGSDNCWEEKNQIETFLYKLSNTIESRKIDQKENSYTSYLFKGGVNRIAQKVGEEAVELVIEAKDNNPELFLNEAADLMFHYLVLLSEKGFDLNDVSQVLKKRSK